MPIEISPWGRWECGEGRGGDKAASQLMVTDRLGLSELLATLPGHSHFLLESSDLQMGEPLSHWPRGRTGTSTLGVTTQGQGLLGPESQSDPWLQLLGGDCYTLVTKSAEVGDASSTPSFSNASRAILG